MLGYLGQILDVFLDELRRSMMVVQHRKDLVHDGMVDLAYSDVDAEEDVDDGEDEGMEGVPYCRPHSLFVVEPRRYSTGGLFRWGRG